MRFLQLLLLLSRFSHVRLFATPWTAAHQAPPSMGFSRQEYWSTGLPLPSLILQIGFHQPAKSSLDNDIIVTASGNTKHKLGSTAYIFFKVNLFLTEG